MLSGLEFPMCHLYNIQGKTLDNFVGQTTRMASVFAVSGLIKDQGVPQPGQGNPKLLGHGLDPLLLFRGIVDACRLCHVGDRPRKSHILPRLGHVTPAYCCVCFCHLAAKPAKHCLLS